MSTTNEKISTDWIQRWSKRENRYYFFNTQTGASQWHVPDSDPVTLNKIHEHSIESKAQTPNKDKINGKRTIEDRDDFIEKRPKVLAPTKDKNNSQIEAKVAIIVPFRDLHHEQNRFKHLNEFHPYISNYLTSIGIKNHHIYIIEQSDDKMKFNRGKLLNCGFDLAKDEYNTFIFHDVDLLPSNDLSAWYSRIPTSPFHIARVWDRYNGNSKYFGGIVSFNKNDFIGVNGYPNNFWGWGGEDDELFKRVQACKLKIVSPESGTITDMENMNLKEKLSLLKQTDWKCMVKWELLQEHETTWKFNGLRSLQYSLVQKEKLSASCTKITVALGLNSHWSDPQTHD